MPCQFRRPPRGAFTLVEMLIAMVLTLILVTAIAQFYAIVGDSVKDGRAMIEMGSQMRAATQRLKADLDLITVSVVPWTDDGSASGYFTYFEGIGNDYNANGNFNAGGAPVPDSTEGLTNLGVTNMIGDGDDFIGFTIRSSGQPFTGRFTNPINTGNPVIYTSQLAEVVWWVGFDDEAPVGSPSGDNVWNFNEPRQLYRRQLLIRPDLTGIDNNFAHPTVAAAQVQLARIWQENDISLSIRAEPGASGVVYRIRPNSLADLSKREYRFAHQPSGLDPARLPALWDVSFPHRQILLPSFSAKSPGLYPPASTQFSFVLQKTDPGFPGESPGEDVVLSNLLAFDVQVYDPYTRLWADSALATALIPSDPGYAGAAAGQPLGMGCYVDLGYYNYANTRILDATLFTSSGYPMPYFADAPSVPPAIPPAGQIVYRNNIGFTYDTWALSYERDGVFQLGPYGVIVGRMDMQTNGLDDDGINGVDDAGEREAVPPYSQPLRGLQVKIRLYEPSTRQVRQATVGTDFITE